MVGTVSLPDRFSAMLQYWILVIVNLSLYRQRQQILLCISPWMSRLQSYQSRCGMHSIFPSLSFSWFISVWGSKDCTTMIVSIRIHFRDSFASHFQIVATSRIAFDILACGGCILFPRWASALPCVYTLTLVWWWQAGIFCGGQSCYHSVCLYNRTRSQHTSYLATNSSLQAMIVQFVVFIGTVIICFSGLMFTLWILGNVSPI